MRKREQERKKEPGVKRRRKELKMKIRKKERLEGNEGSTYGTGIGVTEEGKTVTKGIIDGLQKSMSQQEIDEISAVTLILNPRQESLRQLKQTACSPIFPSTWRRQA